MAQDKNNTSPRSLPRSQEALGLLLAMSDRFLAFMEGHQQRQRTRLEQLRAVISSPDRSLQGVALLRQISQASQEQWSQGGPDAELLFDYINQTHLHAAHERRKGARARMAAKSRPLTILDLFAWLKAFEQLIGADEDQLRPFRVLRRKLINALDASADTSADISKKIIRILPKDYEVLRLNRLIEAAKVSLGPPRSQNELALEVTNGDEKKAASLTRKWRRFKSRLNTAIDNPPSADIALDE